MFTQSAVGSELTGRKLAAEANEANDTQHFWESGGALPALVRTQHVKFLNGHDTKPTHKHANVNFRGGYSSPITKQQNN